MRIQDGSFSKLLFQRFQRNFLSPRVRKKCTTIKRISITQTQDKGVTDGVVAIFGVKTAPL